MGRKYSAIGIIILVVLIIFVSGCIKETSFEAGHFEELKSEPSNRFIGLWENRTLDNSNLPVTMSFQEEGRGVLHSATEHVDFEYEILDNKTLKYTEYGEKPVDMRYWFKADDMLVLEMPGPTGKTNVTWTRVVFKTYQID